MKLTTEQWLHGLIAAFIGGLATAVDSGLTLLIVAPGEFNLGAGFRKTLVTIAVLGLLSGAKLAFAYLKQSPLPAETGGKANAASA